MGLETQQERTKGQTAYLCRIPWENSNTIRWCLSGIPAWKKERVAGMFNDIAHRYDFQPLPLVRVLICAGEKGDPLIEGYQSQTNPGCGHRHGGYSHPGPPDHW